MVHSPYPGRREPRTHGRQQRHAATRPTPAASAAGGPRQHGPARAGRRGSRDSASAKLARAAEPPHRGVERGTTERVFCHAPAWVVRIPRPPHAGPLRGGQPRHPQRGLVSTRPAQQVHPGGAGAPPRLERRHGAHGRGRGRSPGRSPTARREQGRPHRHPVATHRPRRAGSGVRHGRLGALLGLGRPTSTGGRLVRL